MKTPRPPRKPAIRCGLATLALVAVTSARAQTFVYSGLGTSSPTNLFSDPGNWVGGVAPASGAGTGLVFAGNLRTAVALDVAGFNANSLLFDATAGPFQMGATGGGSFNLLANGGVGPSLVANARSYSIIQAPIALGASPLTVGGSGSLSLNSLLSGGPGASSIALRIAQTGSGFRNQGSPVSLGNANTFAGDVELASGNLQITAPASGLGPATNALAVTGAGTGLAFGPYTVSGTVTNIAVPNPIRLDRTLTVGGFYAADLSGPISGSGDLVVAPTNSVGLPNLFTGASAFTGTLALRGTGLGNSTAVLSGGGTMLAANYAVGPNSTLRVDDTGTNVPRLNPSGTLALDRGTFALVGNASADSAESVATLRTSGQANLTLTGGTGGAATLNVGAWVRGPRSTAVFSGAGASGAQAFGAAGPGNGNVVLAADPGGSVGGGGGAGATNRSVLPYAYLAINNALAVQGATGGDLVRYDGATGRIVPLAANEYARDAAAANGGTSVRLGNGGYASASFLTGLGALVLDTSTVTTAPSGASLSSSGPLNVVGGTVLSVASGSAFLPQVPSQISTPLLEFGAATGYVHTQAALVVNSTILGSAGVVKSGPQTLVLNGANGFTGGLTVNAGTVQFERDAALGAAGLPVTLNAAAPGAGNGFATGGLLALSSGLYGDNRTALSTNRPLVLGPNGGVIGTNSTPLSNTSLAWNGVVSGTGTLYKNGSGLLTLANPANTYSGDTVVTLGTLGVGSSGALGTGSVLLAGGTLAATSSFTTDRTVGLVGAASTGLTGIQSFLFTGTNTLGLSGSLVGNTPGASLTKFGEGDLNLTGASTYRGALNIGQATPTVNLADPVRAQAGGAVRISGPNGQVGFFNIPSGAATAAVLQAGGSLIVDNAAAASNARLVPGSGLGLAGGNFTFLGNAATPVRQELGSVLFGATTVNGFTASTGSGLGNTVTVASNGAATTLSATSLAGGGAVYFRGTALGSGNAGSSSVLVSTAPTLVNGILPNATVSASATGEATDFATYGLYGVAPYSGYVAGLSGAGATATVDQTGSVATLSGPQTVNALRLGAAGGVNLGANTLTLGTGELLAAGGANLGITGGTLALGTANGRFTTSNDLFITSAITGTGGLNKLGSGTLTLSGASGPTGNSYVSAGTLAYGSPTALPTSTFLNIAPGATLSLANAGGPVALAGIQGYGTVALGNAALSLIGTGTTSAAAFTGGASSSLTVTNAASTTLNGDSPAFAGSVRILSGTLNVQTNGAAGSNASPILLGDTSGTAAATLGVGPYTDALARDIVVQAGGTGVASINGNGYYANSRLTGNVSLGRDLTVTNSSNAGFGAITLAGTVSGAGALNLRGAGSVNLSGNNTYTGGTNLNLFTNNVLGLGSDTALGTGTLTLTGPTATTYNPGYLRADNGPRTIANRVVASGQLVNSSFGIAGSNDLTFTGGFDLGTGNQSVNDFSTGVTTFAGPVTNGTLNKLGSGALVLSSGTNAFTAPLAVSAGTLSLENAAGAAAADVNVNGGLLAGTGSASGAVTLASGAGLAPGSVRGGLGSAGTLTVGSLGFNPGANIFFDLGDTSQDLVNVSGAFTKGTTGAGAYRFAFSTAKGAYLVPGTYTLVNFGSNSGFSASDFSFVGTPGLEGGFLLDSNRLQFRATAVPEPATLAALGLGALALLKRRRKSA